MFKSCLSVKIDSQTVTEELGSHIEYAKQRKKISEVFCTNFPLAIGNLQKSYKTLIEMRRFTNDSVPSNQSDLSNAICLLESGVIEKLKELLEKDLIKCRLELDFHIQDSENLFEQIKNLKKTPNNIFKSVNLLRKYGEIKIGNLDNNMKKANADSKQAASAIKLYSQSHCHLLDEPKLKSNQSIQEEFAPFLEIQKDMRNLIKKNLFLVEQENQASTSGA